MTQFSFPFKGKNNTELLDEQLFHELLRNQPSGNWLVSRDGWWHGGIHFSDSSSTEVDMAAGVRCIADGEVVAYRLNMAPLSTVSDQTGSKAVPYSTGFVLVKHQLIAPKPDTPPPVPQQAGPIPATATPTAPEPKTLVFFSLYMHLQSLEEYQANDAKHPNAKQQRPAFWQQVYMVSDKANDRPHLQTGKAPCGANVHKTASPGNILGILPVGTELLLRGRPCHHYIRIAEILDGPSLLSATMGHTPDPLIAQGWVYQPWLHPVDIPKTRSLLDKVIILKEPYTIKAGELIGHLGQYCWHSLPDNANRMLHLEVFCGDELPGFIAASQAVAAKLKRDSCTILKTGLGAVLWEKKTTSADSQIPSNTKLVAPANDKHTDTAWIQVSAAGQPYWISRQDWGAIQQHGSKTSNSVAAWRAYPESFNAPANQQAHTTGVDQYHPLSWLEQHKTELGARDQGGNRWWKVHSALRTTSGFTDIEGWVKAIQHPGGHVTSEHPGDWVDFQLEASDEGKTGTLFSDNKQFKDYLDNPQSDNGSKEKLAPLFQQLHGFMTRGSNGSHAANDLRQVASSRWVTERLARAIARHDSEWSANSTAKWKKLKRVLQTESNKALWEQELIRIDKLAWWEQVDGKVKDFPASSKVYHLHPVALVGNFSELENSSCGWKYINEFQVTKYGDRYGPVYWGNITLESCKAMNALLESGKITINEKIIFSALSANEGKLDTVQSYDSEVVTAGIMQKTISITGMGEFSNQVLEFKNENNDLYSKLFENCGWTVSLQSGAAIMHYQHPNLTNSEKITGQILKNLLRSECTSKSYGQKIKSAPLATIVNAITNNKFIEKQILDLKKRLDSCLELKPLSYDYKIREYILSNLGRATILDHSTNRPGYVAKDFGDSLSRFFKLNPLVSKNPNTWKQERETNERIIIDDYGTNRRMTDAHKRYTSIKKRI